MAYKPSMRRSGAGLDLELDIKPVMNLMVVLIPLLLAGVEYVKLSIIEIDLPPTSAGAGAGEEQENPEKEREQRLGLKIAITQEGFTIATASAIMSSEEEGQGGPTVPLNGEREFDYDKLKEKLVEIKKLILDKKYKFKDKETAVITAGRDIEYQIIVNVLDTIQKYTDDDGNIQPLFPQVNFGQIIV
jgi:biopolymer transport protein ExbD